MDRIQQALYKQQQSQSLEHAENDLIGKIHYTQTRVEQVDKATLLQNHIIADCYDMPESMLFRMLRTQLLQKMRRHKWQVMAVTAPSAGEGTSMIAANLAVAMAMELNQTVLLVDLNLRHPAVAKQFGLSPQLGITDYLDHTNPLADILINPGIERLVLLPSVGEVIESAELLSSPTMAALMTELRLRYPSRFILLDLPPLLPTDDVLLCQAYVDSTLLVIADGKNKPTQLKQVRQLLARYPLAGTVLNKSEQKTVQVY